jgi:hypothetical protein
MYNASGATNGRGADVLWQFCPHASDSQNHSTYRAQERMLRKQGSFRGKRQVVTMVILPYSQSGGGKTESVEPTKSFKAQSKVVWACLRLAVESFWKTDTGSTSARHHCDPRSLDRKRRHEQLGQRSHTISVNSCTTTHFSKRTRLAKRRSLQTKCGE